MASGDDSKLIRAIFKQAVRDIASKDLNKSTDAMQYLKSEDFLDLCDSLNINHQGVVKSIMALTNYPLISRKKLANNIAREIDALV
jgi:hypothetical protein